MVSAGSPKKDTAAPASPGARSVDGASKGSTGQASSGLLSPSSAFAAASALSLEWASHYTGLMMGMLRGSLDLAKDYNAALEESLRGRIKADIAGKSKPKPAEPPPVKVAKVRFKPNEDLVKKTAVARPAKADKAVGAGSGVQKKAVPKAGAPATGDDLKRISGIGPKLEKMLQDKGLCRFSDIASLTEDGARKLDAELGLGGRILKDGWVGAAKALQPPK
jgi:NADH-quinone oxidoreductase subunit E